MCKCMTTFRIILLLNLILHFAHGQKDNFYISGRVTDSETPNSKIYGLIVKILFNDSVFNEVACDTLGYYKVAISPKYSSAKITVSQDDIRMQADFPKNTECSNFIQPTIYFVQDYRIINPIEKNKDYVADFSIKKAIIDRRLPCLSFEKNTTIIKKCSSDSSDYLIKYIKCLLQENPKTIIEIHGKSWDERHHKMLSKKRAALIKNKLINLGIDKKRIKTKALADSQPLFSAQTIADEHNDYLKVEMEDKNRSISFVILSFDYDPVLKKIIRDNRKTNADKDDDD